MRSLVCFILKKTFILVDLLHTFSRPLDGVKNYL